MILTQGPSEKCLCVLGIGNGVGKQGRGNQPPRRYGPDTEFQYRPRKPHGLAKPSRILSKREADTEFQYRPHIVDTDIDCGRHFCGCHFRDFYVFSVYWFFFCPQSKTIPQQAPSTQGKRRLDSRRHPALKMPFRDL